MLECLGRVAINHDIQFDLIEVHLILEQWDRKANILKSPNFHLKWGTKFAAAQNQILRKTMLYSENSKMESKWRMPLVP